ncbi:hypothetical protein [Aeromicrobium sp. 179-A 4D2 NHS]|uniref:hypothetical protein n=1 Tax=Aeromicrobium sp. 179-A 4D2 NHS TaxID=3142375 RepID=UPI0039A21D9A
MMEIERVAERIARDAEDRGEGICRTCAKPIWNEGGTINGREVEEGWSDRIAGRDSLVCFAAIDYRHVPLTGREAFLYDLAYQRGAATAARVTDTEKEKD